MFERTILAFGSESGNAERMAQRLSAQLQQQSLDVSCEALDNLNLKNLDAKDLLLVITSTFGDGDPPGNARAFAEQLSATQTVSPFQYAVFGLGDVGYPKFCQFGKAVDTSLAEKGARRLVNRVDADLDYLHFFSRWEHCVSDILAGKRANGLDLALNVTAYSERHPYLATVNSVEQIGDSSEDIYHVNLSIRNSDMNYRAGDLLYVLPDDDAELYAELFQWFGQDISPLAGKELRTPSKSLLRGLAAASGNKTLKENLKIKNKAALADYRYGRDLLEVLKDCGEPGFISVESLADLLSPRSARAYLVASCGVAEGGTDESIHLCVRDIDYQAFGRNHSGATSHVLCQAKSGDQVKVFVRSNPDFWLDAEATDPVLMIAEETGIAPYLSFLQAMENASDQRQTMLFFGGNFQSKESLYQPALTDWLEKRVLTTLKIASSEEQKEDYIENALLEAAPDIYQMLAQHAHIYICGSKQTLDKPVNKVLTAIIQKYEMCSEAEANERLQQLRVHKSLY